MLGAAAGIALAGSAALIKVCTDVAARNIAALWGGWQLYALIVVGAAALVLSQLSYRAGPMSASLPAINTINPLVSVSIGWGVFDERFRTAGGAVALETASLVLALAATMALSRRSALASPARRGLSTGFQPAVGKLHDAMRRRMQLAGILVAATLSAATAACSRPSTSPPPAAGARAVASPRTSTATSSTDSSGTSTSASSTFTPSTTLAAPSLPVPKALTGSVSPLLPGEGSWQSAGDHLVGGHAIYTTTRRPAAGLPPSGIAWVDSNATTLSLYAGAAEPYGVWPQQSYVPASQQPLLMAAFNSGFKIYHYQTGWYDRGRTAVALQPGAASLVIYRNGTATVARDATMGPDVVAVRQNLSLLVDRGQPTPATHYRPSGGRCLAAGTRPGDPR